MSVPTIGISSGISSDDWYLIRGVQQYRQRRPSHKAVLVWRRDVDSGLGFNRMDEGGVWRTTDDSGVLRSAPGLN